MLSIHLLYRRPRNSVVKTLGVDVIATSHTTSAFNMADVNLYECDSSMATPTLKSNAGDQKVCNKKNHGCLVPIEKSVPRDHCLASLGKAS